MWGQGNCTYPEIIFVTFLDKYIPLCKSYGREETEKSQMRGGGGGGVWEGGYPPSSAQRGKLNYSFMRSPESLSNTSGECCV